MALDDIVRNVAVGLTRQITRPLHVPIIHRAWIGQDPYGTPIYAAPSVGVDGGTLRGIVENKQRLRQLSNGRVILTKAYIAILEPIAPNGAAGRTEPIDTRDYIELPDGTTGPIADVNGVVDPDTNFPYFSEIWLGSLNYS